MQTFLAFIFVIGILVMFHETGHFLVAKRMGIGVEVFAFGFGPTLVSKRWGETVYKINLFPLGGYVKMVGEEGESQAENSFIKKSPSQRMLVIIAGPLMNLVLALLIFCLAGIVFGLPDKTSNVVLRVVEGMEAERIGLKPGDKIIAINDKRITDGEQMIKIIHGSANKRLRLQIEREGKRFYLYATPKLSALQGKKVGLIGFNPKPIMKRYGPLPSISIGVKQTAFLTWKVIEGVGGIFKRLLRGENPQVGGPVLIAQMAGQAAQFGMGSLLFFLAFLSVNIGVLMVLPLPALDGGHLVFLGIEAIRGKPIDPRKENFVHTLGFAFLILLMVIITYGDLVRKMPKIGVP